MKRQALGKGLESLLPRTQVAEPSEGLMQLPLDQIRPNPRQPRGRFDEAELADLAASIRSVGLLQPILVRPGEGRFELIAGERRLRAARLAGLITIPAIVRKIDLDHSLELALIENIQRQQLSPMDEARAFEKLMSEYGLTQELVATKVGRARSTIANTLRLLNLPAKVQAMLDDGILSAGHAKALLSIKTPTEILAAAEKMAAGETTVRQAEVLARSKRDPHQGGDALSGAVADPNVRDAELRLQRVLGTKVRIRISSEGKGKLEIEFYSDEELQRLFEILESAAVTQATI